MQLYIFQKGFNYAQDGPGNRLVYHLQGCNFNCPWCANPESMPLSGGVATDVDALLDEADRCRLLFTDGGGITFTGGEPTLQYEALRCALQGLNAVRIDTAIETNASHSRLPELFGLVDHLIIDLKITDPVRHKRHLGAQNDTVLHNIRRASEAHADVCVRIPLVRGYNASREDMEAAASFLAGCGGAIRCELLRYHEYGRDKWGRLGLPYAVRDGFVTDEQVNDATRVLESKGISVVTS